MSDCQDIKKQLPPEFWKALMLLPAFRYLKAPVDKATDLYKEYPIGNEKGSFAFVYDENTFYTYHPRGVFRGQWKPISGGISSLFDIMETELLKDGDILVWDTDKQKFVVVNISLWGTEEY